MNEMKEITMEEIGRRALSVVADKPYEGVSHKYAFVPTTKMIEVAGNLGWKPYRVTQSGVMKEKRRGTQRHHVSFYNPKFTAPGSSGDLAVGDIAYAGLGVVNAHDATSSFQAFLEIWRKVCGNGVIAATDKIGVERVRHIGFTASDAERSLTRLINGIPVMAEKIKEMQARTLSPVQRLDFASESSLLRWDEVPERKIKVEDLLRIRRAQDRGDDLWTVFNRVQENLLGGGVRIIRPGKPRNIMPVADKIRRSMRVKSVDTNVSINKGLWSLATGLLK